MSDWPLPAKILFWIVVPGGALLAAWYGYNKFVKPKPPASTGPVVPKPGEVTVNRG